MSKEIDLGNGLRLTESEDMGIYIHYKSKSGNQTGMFLGNTNNIPGHLWAVELLADVEEREQKHLEECRTWHENELKEWIDSGG